MLIIRISLNISGSKFFPDMFCSKNNIECYVFDINQPINLINDTELNENGYISILNPKKIGVQYELIEYGKWYIDFLVANYERLIKLGAENFNLFFEVFYTKQCNFEIFDNSLLKNISQYNISLPVSVYLVTNDEIEEMLIENGYTKEYIKSLNIEDN